MNRQCLKQRSVMYITSKKTTGQKKILAKAVLSAAERLGLNKEQIAVILQLDSSTLSKTELELDPDSEQDEHALLLIRIYISLYALTGENIDWIQHFMKTINHGTGGIPMQQIYSPSELATVLKFVEAMQEKL